MKVRIEPKPLETAIYGQPFVLDQVRYVLPTEPEEIIVEYEDDTEFLRGLDGPLIIRTMEEWIALGPKDDSEVMIIENGYDPEFCLSKQFVIRRENKNYKKQLSKYNENLLLYKTKFEEYNKIVEIHNEGIATRKEAYERDLLEKLKAKYE